MEINLLLYLPDKTFIYIDDKLRKELFDDVIRTTLTNFSKKNSLKMKNLSRYKVGTRAIPKKVFLKLLKTSKIKLKTFNKKITIKVGRRGNKVKMGPFLTITPEWVYISELIRGDGSLCRGNNYSYTTCFANKNTSLINLVQNFFIKQGLNQKHIGIYNDSKDPDMKYLYAHSEIFSYLLKNFFLIPFGKKGDLFLPRFIKREPQFYISAIRGIFDAEGCITYKREGKQNKKTLTIGMKDGIYIKDIHKALSSLGIKSNLYQDKKKLYRLYIQSIRDITRFYRIVKPEHTKKIPVFKQIIKNCKKSKSNNSIFFKIKILKILEKKDSKMRDVCEKRNISNSKAGNNLYLLKKEKLIEVKKAIKTNKGCWFIYSITEKGKNYLNSKISNLSLIFS
tara:strand:+ start:975 stop:2156 length:1182 start_codon:yes stop_codon:yes gene_type:complete